MSKIPGQCRILTKSNDLDQFVRYSYVIIAGRRGNRSDHVEDSRSEHNGSDNVVILTKSKSNDLDQFVTLRDYCR